MPIWIIYHDDKHGINIVWGKYAVCSSLEIYWALKTEMFDHHYLKKTSGSKCPIFQN